MGLLDFFRTNKKKGSAFDRINRGNRYRRVLRSLNQDTRQIIPVGTHQEMISAGRWLYSNFGPVRGAISEQVRYSVQPFAAQYTGQDKEWGEQAEAWLKQWHEVMDIQGRCSFEELLGLSLISVLREGDAGMLLTQYQGGYPAVQFIPAHRVSSPMSGEIKKGRFNGQQIHNGVITNKNGRTIGFELNDGRRLSSANMALCFFPEWSDQGRGITPLAAVVNDFQDVKEIRDYELLAQKAGSSISIIEHNENGEADEALEEIEQTTSGGTLETTTETIEGGLIRYFKAGSESKLETFQSNRPSANAQEFEATIMRAAFQAIEWPYDLSIDPTKVGGASVRLVAAKAQKTIEKNQRLMAKLAKRIDGYAIAKAIKLGLLPMPRGGDWYSWKYQGPRKLTVDAGRDSKSLAEMYKLGMTNLAEIYGESGGDWLTEVKKKIDEQKIIMELAEQAGVPLERIQLLTPNANETTSGQNSADDE